MNTKTFILGFFVVYLLISLPAMLGIGYVIDWIPETTFLQKFKGNVIEGLTNNYLIKIVISVIGSAIFSLFLSKSK
ncbi:hypothetical protein WAK64_14000 [Bacillus spongiae]|uniref:Uncharacterized protein n=1 Tax=Bacillus spongiae TaxID=2683610 RepID=A0ABU8HFW8_9BACI